MFMTDGKPIPRAKLEWPWVKLWPEPLEDIWLVVSDEYGWAGEGGTVYRELAEVLDHGAKLE